MEKSNINKYNFTQLEVKKVSNGPRGCNVTSTAATRSIFPLSSSSDTVPKSSKEHIQMTDKIAHKMFYDILFTFCISGFSNFIKNNS